MRIVILTVPFGGGHNAIASAIRECLSSEVPGSAAEVIDPLELLPIVPAARVAAFLYRTLSRQRLRWIYALLYNVTDRYPAATMLPTTWLLGRSLRRVLHEIEPDAVVSTFPHLTYCASQAVTKLGRSYPLFTIVTDAGKVNASWFKCRSSWFAVPDKVVADRARELGIDDDRIVVSGTPVRRQFVAIPDRQEARRRLGLADRRTILIWGGRIGPAVVTERMLARIILLEPASQLVVLAGDDRALIERLARGHLQGDVTVRGLVANPVDYLRAADVVIGKAGWLSLVEAALSDRITVVADCLPGQEVENLAVAIQNGWAISVLDGDDAALRKALAQAASQITIVNKPFGPGGDEVARLVMKRLLLK